MRRSSDRNQPTRYQLATNHTSSTTRLAFTYIRIECAKVGLGERLRGVQRLSDGLSCLRQASAFLPRGLRARARLQLEAIVIGPRRKTRIDETAKGRDEARGAVVWVPRGTQRIAGVEPHVHLVRFLQLEEEVRDDDRCESADRQTCEQIVAAYP